MKKLRILWLLPLFALASCQEEELITEQNTVQTNSAILKAAGSGWVTVTSSCTAPSSNLEFYGVTNNTVNRTDLSDANNGMVGWKLVDALSDEFDYPAGKSASIFNTKWKLGFVNDYTGPAPTKWTGSQVTFETISGTNRAIVLKAVKSGTDLLCGMLTSYAASTFPLYQEVKVKVSNSQLANAVWMISNDQQQLEEIDNLEAYGPSVRSNGTPVAKPWYSNKLHLSHHTFKYISGVRKDYQPQESTWMMRRTGDCSTGVVNWNDTYHILGVKWESATKLIYYVDGIKVKTVTVGTEGIDPLSYTQYGGLYKEMCMVISQAAQTWRYGGETEFWNSGDDIVGDNTKMYIDWIKVYTPSGQINKSTKTYTRI
nr:beta-agarase [uncultured bacterium]